MSAPSPHPSPPLPLPLHLHGSPGEALPALKPSPSRHPDCCLSLSTALIGTLARTLPGEPHKVLSVGAGSGLLEALLLLPQHGHYDGSGGSGGYSGAGGADGPTINIYAVEVAAAGHRRRTPIRYLPAERALVARGSWELLGPLAKPMLARRPRYAEGGPSVGRVASERLGSVRAQDSDDDDDNDDDEEGENVDLRQVRALMFVYPRDPRLVARYMAAYRPSRPSDSQVGTRGGGRHGADDGGRPTEDAMVMVVWAGPRADWPEYEPIFRASLPGELDVLVGEEAGIEDGEMVVILK